MLSAFHTISSLFQFVIEHNENDEKFTEIQKWLEQIDDFLSTHRQHPFYPSFLIRALNITGQIRDKDPGFYRKHTIYRKELSACLNDPNFKNSDVLTYLPIELYDEEMLQKLTSKDDALWKLNENYAQKFKEIRRAFIETYAEGAHFFGKNSEYPSIYNLLVGDPNAPIVRRPIPPTPGAALAKAAQQIEMRGTEKAIRFGALGGSDLKGNEGNHFRGEWIGIYNRDVHFLGNDFFRSKKDPCYADRAFFKKIDEQTPVLAKQFGVLVIPDSFNSYLKTDSIYRCFDGHGFIRKSTAQRLMSENEKKRGVSHNRGWNSQLMEHFHVKDIPLKVIEELANSSRAILSNEYPEDLDSKSLHKILSIGYPKTKTYLAVPSASDQVVIPIGHDDLDLQGKGCSLMRPPHETPESIKGIPSKSVIRLPLGAQALSPYGDTLQYTLTGFSYQINDQKVVSGDAEAYAGFFAKGLLTVLDDAVCTEMFGKETEIAISKKDVKLDGNSKHEKAEFCEDQPVPICVVGCLQKKETFKAEARIAVPPKIQTGMNGDFDGDLIHFISENDMPNFVHWLIKKSQEEEGHIFSDARLKPPKSFLPRSNIHEAHSWMVEVFQARYPLMGKIYTVASKILNSREAVQKEMAKAALESSENLLLETFPELKGAGLSDEEILKKEIVLLCKLSTDLFKTTVPFNAVHERILFYERMVTALKLEKPAFSNKNIYKKMDLEGKKSDRIQFFKEKFHEDAVNVNFSETAVGRIITRISA